MVIVMLNIFIIKITKSTFKISKLCMHSIKKRQTSVNACGKPKKKKNLQWVRSKY